MIFNANKEIDVVSARTRLEFLIKNKKRFELTQKRESRTLSQNGYLYLLISWFSLETGYSKDESKQIYKNQSPDLFVYEKNEISFIRSSSDLNTKEMSLSIERFRNYSTNQVGVYLPEPDEKEYLESIEQELNRYENKIFVP